MKKTAAFSIDVEILAVLDDIQKATGLSKSAILTYIIRHAFRNGVFDDLVERKILP